MNESENITGVDLAVLVLLSGGIDSTACVNYYLSRGYKVSALHISYGQPYCTQEQASASSVASYFGISFQHISVAGSFFAEGYISSRNAVLLCLALMVSRGEYGLIALGIHADTPYVDCSPKFVDLLQDVFNLYEQGRIRVAAPFLTWTKSEIWDYAQMQHVPLHLTHSSNSSFFQSVSEDFLKAGE